MHLKTPDVLGLNLQCLNENIKNGEKISQLAYSFTIMLPIGWTTHLLRKNFTKTSNWKTVTSWLFIYGGSRLSGCFETEIEIVISKLSKTKQNKTRQDNENKVAKSTCFRNQSFDVTISISVSISISLVVQNNFLP